MALRSSDRQRYPERAVTMALPFPLGGSTGYTATVLARGLTAVLGQSFSVEPRTGNFGIAALQYLRDHADGYTLLVGNLTSNSMTPVFHRDKMGFDYVAEIAPISKIADFQSVVMTRVSEPADTLAGFLAHLQKMTGKLIYGTDFLGAYVDVDAIALGKASGLEVAYCATDGANGIFADLLAGRIDIAFINVATATSNIGKFKPLAVYGDERLANFADVPTMTEAGYQGVGTVNWQGLFTSRRAQPEIIARLHEAVIAAMGTDASKEAFADVNAAIATSESPQAFAEEIRLEMVTWERLKPEILALPQADAQRRAGRAPS